MTDCCLTPRPAGMTAHTLGCLLRTPAADLMEETRMTWLTTWPSTAHGPQYAPHDTEAAAEAHAREIVTTGRAPHATAFEVDGEEWG